jgi:hypothetical protein
VTFEVFNKQQRGGKTRLSSDLVSISASGLVSIGEATWEEIGSPEAVVVLVDVEAKKMRIEPARPGIPSCKFRQMRARRVLYAPAALEAAGRPPKAPSEHLPVVVSSDGVEFSVVAS